MNEDTVQILKDCRHDFLLDGDGIAAKAIEDILNEVEEYDQLFDLCHSADMRALKMWQAETGKVMTHPDQASLCVWLLTILDRIRKQATDCLNDLDSTDDVKRCAAEIGMAMISDPDKIPLGNGKWTSIAAAEGRAE